MILGICGGIATGKSTLAKKIARGKIPILELDAISREVFEDIHIKRTLFRVFKTLDRREIGKIVFERHPEKLALLEKITHPKMRMILFQKIREQKNAIVVAALPVSFCFEEICDQILVLSVSPKITWLRAQSRGISRGAFQNINRRQVREKI